MGSLVKKAKNVSFGKALLTGLLPTREIGKVIGRKNMDQITPIGTSLEKQYDAAKAAQRAAEEMANKPVIPLPDEEELYRQRRRRNARRGGGRESTFLSSDALGG